MRRASRLEDKVAVVTGAGTGIGRAIATVFAAEGAKVVLAGRRAAPLISAADEIKRVGGEATAVPGDVTSGVVVTRLAEAAQCTYGPIDILANNAGAVVSRTNLLDCTEADWLQTIQLNLHSAYLCSKAMLPDLIRTKGNILQVASVFGLFGAANTAAYTASKGALISLTRAMAVDFGQHGVRVNALCPAYVETDMNREMLDGFRDRGEFATILNRLPLGTLGRTIDVANAALFLASDEANWITGVVLPVDGGMSAVRA
jgi:NAD(P)-dependent dehydrogenase (short-subunit alcohol dehydrogenase family)